MAVNTLDFLTFMYPALLFVIGTLYLICSKWSKPNFFIGYRNKLNRNNETLWKISNFISGTLFLLFCFFHSCVLLALIAIKYLANASALNFSVLILISQALWIIELVAAIKITNAFIRYVHAKTHTLSDDEQPAPPVKN